MIGAALACDSSQPETPVPSDPTPGSKPVMQGSFVGAAVCAECHTDQAERWRGSHHDLAMQEAEPSSVLGSFDGRTVRQADRVWRFLREGEAYLVELSDGDEPSQRLRVRYVFGVQPLQQLLVERGEGRLQALPVAWDARPGTLGGQRWFSLQPDEVIRGDDPLHWDGLAYNWNSQCAACHSTAVREHAAHRNEEPRVFDTRWREIDVACEACHGPGAQHVRWAHSAADVRRGTSTDRGLAVALESWNPSAWQRLEEARIALRAVPRRADNEIDVCGPCHARRTSLVESPRIGEALLDAYRPSLLEPGLYFDDGQIREEVYVWGSFLQSRMHAAGVRCSDCHDPHSLELRRPGNALCGGCHAETVYDGPQHHGHPLASEGAQCVACHMPERTYMQVDPRRDHAFRVPRPLRSEALASPDACRACHAEDSASWAQAAIDRWRDPDRPAPTDWSDALVQGAAVRRDVRRWLEVATHPQAPSIIRGSAWLRYATEADSAPPLEFLRERIARAEPLERLGLIEVAGRLAPEPRLALVQPLLEDPSRAVRIAAAQALVDVPSGLWRPADRASLARALREYRTSHEVHAERPEAQVSLGLLALRYGETEQARAAYRRAIERAPYFLPAYVNLADLERLSGRDEASVEWLRKAVVHAPENATVRHALGLALYRAGQPQAALAELAAAAASAPDDGQLVLGHALALDALQRRPEALDVLEAALARGVIAADVYHALVSFLHEEGEFERARGPLAAWQAAHPGDDRWRRYAPSSPSAASGLSPGRID